MPPSSKTKHPKTRPGFSAATPDRSPFSRSASAPSVSPRGEEAGNEAEEEARSLRLLSKATTKFPGFISDGAFRGRVTDVDSSWDKDGGRAKVWLSEAAMVASSLRPGSLVSVSLAASDEQISDDIPLDALSYGCCKHFGLDVDGITISGMGRYFAIANVFSSQKILKTGVKLSWSLSCTMGFPATGRMIFVFPIGDTSTQLLHGVDKMHRPTSRNGSFVSLCTCGDLYLNPVSLNIDQMFFTGRSSAVYDSINSSQILSRELSSPKTPCYKQKLSSPASSPALFKGSQSYASGTGCYPNIHQSVVIEAAKDDKTNELLLTYAVRWFHRRYLLNGNILTLPIFGQLYIFKVEGAITSSGDIASEDHMYDRQLPSETKVSDSLLHEDTIFLVDSRTRVHLTPMPSATENPNKDIVSLKLLDKDFRIKEAGNIPRLGGLSKEYTLLMEIISFSFSCESFLPRYKGVLLYGPPGTGKTSLACSCAHDAGANLFVVNGPEIVSEYYGESELKLLEVFDSAKAAIPAVVFIDELDAIAPARKEGGEGLSLRIVATLLELMDGIGRSDGILVIAATNRPDSIDPALRRPGRLDREIEIGVPTPDQRLDIISGILRETKHLLSDEEIRSLAFATHGFVGADLSALCNEAAMFALRRYIKSRKAGAGTRCQWHHCCGQPYSKHDRQIGESQSFNDSGDHNISHIAEVDFMLSSMKKLSISSNPVPDHIELQESTNADCVLEESSDLKVLAEDFEQAKLKIRPSAMREVMIEVPKVCWEDVGGQNEVKRQLIEAVQLPQICPDAFKRIGICPPRGLLMFGPPGCSKTLLARAVASEAKLNFLAVKGPELLSKWVGESEKAISSLFAKARANSPSIIFFDEIDGLAAIRGQENDGTSVGDRVISQLLVELDGLDQRSGVTVIAATNRPDKIDPALLRPGRFDRHLGVKPPDVNDRECILRIHTRGMPISSEVNARELALLTEGYSGADLKLLCREAAIAAIEESFDISEISMVHFKVAIGRVQPADVRFYLDISDKFERFVDSRTRDDEVINDAS